MNIGVAKATIYVREQIKCSPTFQTFLLIRIPLGKRYAYKNLQSGYYVRKNWTVKVTGHFIYGKKIKFQSVISTFNVKFTRNSIKDNCKKCCSSFANFVKIGGGYALFSDGRNYNYISVCIVKPYIIFKANNSLLKSVYCVAAIPFVIFFVRYFLMKFAQQIYVSRLLIYQILFKPREWF